MESQKALRVGCVAGCESGTLKKCLVALVRQGLLERRRFACELLPYHRRMYAANPQLGRFELSFARRIGSPILGIVRWGLSESLPPFRMPQPSWSAGTEPASWPQFVDMRPQSTP
jgi:hypothetical protein